MIMVLYSSHVGGWFITRNVKTKTKNPNDAHLCHQHWRTSVSNIPDPHTLIVAPTCKPDAVVGVGREGRDSGAVGTSVAVQHGRGPTTTAATAAAIAVAATAQGGGDGTANVVAVHTSVVGTAVEDVRLWAKAGRGYRVGLFCRSNVGFALHSQSGTSTHSYSSGY